MPGQWNDTYPKQGTEWQPEETEHPGASVLEIVECLDWIDPAFAEWCVLCGHVCISIWWWWDDPAPACFAEKLRAAEIEIGGRVIVAGDGYVITVPSYQEAEARQILEEAGAILA